MARTLQSIKEDVKLIYSRNVADKRRDTLANNTFELCKAFSAFYNSRIFFIEQIALEQPPIYLVQAVNELANGLNSALQSLSETEREQLLQYFYEWTNVTPSEFITKIESLTKLMYDHTNINPVSYTHLDVYKRQVVIRLSVRLSYWLSVVEFPASS